MWFQFPRLTSFFSQHGPDSSRSRIRLEWHLVDSIIVSFYLLSILKIFVGLSQLRVMCKGGLWKAYSAAAVPGVLG